jgi:hypothetical protein
MVHLVILNEVKDLNLYENTRFFAALRMTAFNHIELYKNLTDC